MGEFGKARTQKSWSTRKKRGHPYLILKKEWKPLLTKTGDIVKGAVKIARDLIYTALNLKSVSNKKYVTLYPFSIPLWLLFIVNTEY